MPNLKKQLIKSGSKFWPDLFLTSYCQGSLQSSQETARNKLLKRNLGDNNGFRAFLDSAVTTTLPCTPSEEGTSPGTSIA